MGKFLAGVGGPLTPSRENTDLLNVCLQTYRNIRVLWKVAYFLKKDSSFMGEKLKNS